MGISTFLQVSLACLLSLVQSQQTLQEFSKTAQPGEVFTRELSEFKQVVGAQKSYISQTSTLKNFFVETGTLTSLNSAPETLDDCIMVRDGNDAWNVAGVCILNSVNASDTSYAYLRPFEIGYNNEKVPTFTINSQSNSEPNRMVVDLPIVGTRFVLIAGDERGTFFLTSTSVGTVASTTILQLYKYKIETSNNAPTITLVWTLKNQTVMGEFTVTNATCITSRGPDDVLLFNPVNSSLPITGGAAQPSNKKILLVKTPSASVNAGTTLLTDLQYGYTNSVPKYIMDLQWFDYSLLVIVVEPDGGGVDVVRVGSCSVAYPGSSVSFSQGLLATTQISRPVSNLEFHHFVYVRERSKINNDIIILVSHTYDSAKSNEGQQITLRPIYIQPQVNPPLPADRPFDGLQPNNAASSYFARVPMQAEIRPKKSNNGALQFNIRYYVNNELHYVDLYSTYASQVVSVRDYTSYTGTRLWRATVMGRFSSGFAYISGQNNFNTAHDNNGGVVGMHGIDRGVIFTNEMADKSMIAVYTFPDTPGSYATTYSLFQQAADSGGKFQTKSIQKHTMEAVNDWFGKISGPTSYSVPGRPKRYGTVPIDLTVFKTAANLSFLFSDLPPTLQILNDKMHFVNFIKSGTFEADEVYFTAAGGIYEDTNRKIGYMKCASKGDYAAGVYNFTCTKQAEIDLPNHGVILVREMISECQSILVLADHRTQNIRTFLQYTQGRFINLLTISKSSPADVYCLGDVVWLLSYDPENRTNNSLYMFKQGAAIGEKVNKSLNLPQDAQNMQYGGFFTIKKANQQQPIVLMAYFMPYGNPKFNAIMLRVIPFSVENNTFLGNDKSPEYRHVAALTKNTKMCLLDNGYIVYDTLTPNSQLKLYPGENYFEAKQYHTAYTFNLSILNLTRVKGFFCHDLDSSQAFSVYGEFDQVTTSPLGTSTKTFTVIATYFAISENPTNRLFNIYNESGVYNSITATDDGDASIFFNMKSKILRVWFTRKPLQFYLGDVTSSLTVNFFIKNDYDKLPATFTINLMAGVPVNFTKRADQLDYKQNTTLMLIPDIVQSISGPVLKIALKNGSNLVAVTNRTTLIGNYPIIRNGTLMGPTQDAFTEASFGYEVIFTKDNVFNIFNRERGFIVSCGSNVLKEKSNPVLWIVFSAATDNSLWQIKVDITQKNCSDMYKLNSTLTGPIFGINPVNGAPLEFQVVSHAGPNYQNEYVLVIFKDSQRPLFFYAHPGDKIAYGSRNITEYSPWNFVPDRVSQVAEADLKMEGYLLTCQAVRAEIEQNPMIVCLTTSGGGQDLYYVVNFGDASINAFEAARITGGNASLVNFSQEIETCAMASSSEIECVAVPTSKQFGRVKLVRNKTGCKSEYHWCFDVIVPGVNYSTYTDIEVKSGDVSKSYTLTVGPKKVGDNVDNDNIVLMIYKNGITDPYYTIELDPSMGITIANVHFAYQDPTMISVYSPKKGSLFVYNISEMVINFPPDTKTNVAGILEFTNLELVTDANRLDLKTLFKEPLVIVPPPVVEKSFWSKYWWIFLTVGVLLAIGGLVAWYLLRRERLRKLAAKKDETIINRLEDFYYR